MKRVLSIAAVLTCLEVWAFIVFRNHPLVRPDWFNSLILVIQLLMCLGGVYACRWLLRHSPVARLEGPQRDWTKLWLWCGPVGGLLLVKACLVGWFVNSQSGSTFLGLVMAAHAAGGAALWVIGLPWAISDLLRDSTTGFRERLLMQLGIASHVIGFAVYFGFYPGKAVPPATLLGAVSLFGFNLYYLMTVSITWWVVFKFWQPRALTPTEQEYNKNLDSPEEYIE